MNQKEFYLDCCGRESALTRKVFSSVPDDGLDYRPNETSRSTRELMGHMIGHEQDLMELAADGVINHRNVVPFDSVAHALQLFDAASASVKGGVSEMDDDAWARSAKFMVGDHVAWEASSGELVWGTLFDSIHHRGQLSTYLRPMGSTVPAIYGPSADDDGSA